MINFYKFYNGNGLDNEHYGQLIAQLMSREFTDKLRPIEHIIKKDSYHAYYYYSVYVIKERWYETEDTIKTDHHWWSCYCLVFNI